MRPTISFCTTLFNRLTQFEQVFESNEAIISENHNFEWVILDFGSTDGTREFVQEWVRRASRRIRFLAEGSGHSWHLSVAKNMAHLNSEGQILFNLDCDNFIGGVSTQITQLFESGCEIAHFWSGIHRDGTCGRIAIKRDLFLNLGGYDEDLYPMGYQDLDLLARAAALGYVIGRGRCAPEMSIPNSKAESIRFCKTSGVDWEYYDTANRARSRENIQAGLLRANARGFKPSSIVEVRGALP